MTEPSPHKEKSLGLKLSITGVVMLLAYAAISWLSFDCEQSDPEKARPLLQVLGLFTIAGVGYLFACWLLIWRNGHEQESGSGFQGLAIIVGFGIVFRLVLLFSIPIQEVDLYRYIWDGTVISQGINPYEYSPLEIEMVPSKGIPDYREDPEEREDLDQLSRLATSPAIEKTFQGVHFEEYTTPYPLTNQVPFAIAAVIGKSIGSYWGMLFSMKGVLILFDLATAFLLVVLLKRLSLPTAWVVAYLWCPLLLKEIANSGHLDSIAVFFNVAAVYMMVVSYWQLAPADGADGGDGDVDMYRSSSFIGSCILAVLLALAVGAKVFPIVLGPIWAILMLKRMKFAAVVPLIIFGITTTVLLWPMVIKTEMAHKYREKAKAMRASLVEQEEYVEKKRPPAPPAGIEAFVNRWEMNDFLFMIVVENLKPYGKTAELYAKECEANKKSTDSAVWFVKTSNEFRHKIVDWYVEKTGGPKHSAHFAMTRRLSLVVFTLIVLWTCVRMWRQDHPLVLLEMVFLTIAWFWFLAPTQNPWYWTWTLPWLMFCRNRIWFGVAIVAMAYYLRFYFEYHGIVAPDESGLFWTQYGGTAFFDFVLPVIEFAPIIFALFLTWITGFWRRSGPLVADT